MDESENEALSAWCDVFLGYMRVANFWQEWCILGEIYEEEDEGEEVVVLRECLGGCRWC